MNQNSQKTVESIKSRLVYQIWKGVAYLAIIALPASLLRATQTGWLPVHTFHLFAGAFVAVIYFNQRRLPYMVSAKLLIFLFVSIGSIGLLALGLLGAGVWWLVVSSLLIYILYSIRAGVVSVFVSMAFTIMCGFLYVNKVVALPFDANVYITSFSSWVTLLVAITLMPLVVFQAIGIYQESILKLLNRIELQREEIKHISMHDQLTDLATLNLTQDRFDVAAQLAMRNKRKMALLFIDIDGFKPINDCYGHEAGDVVLVEIANRLKSVCRKEDTASRVGGDEFTLLLGDIHSESDALLAAERVLESLRPEIKFNNKTLSIGASIGISVFPDHADSLKLLRKKADDAMYVVKRTGKNDYHLFDESVDPTATLQ